MLCCSIQSLASDANSHWTDSTIGSIYTKTLRRSIHCACYLKHRDRQADKRTDRQIEQNRTERQTAKELSGPKALKRQDKGNDHCEVWSTAKWTLPAGGQLFNGQSPFRDIGPGIIIDYRQVQRNIDTCNSEHLLYTLEVTWISWIIDARTQFAYRSIARRWLTIE